MTFCNFFAGVVSLMFASKYFERKQPLGGVASVNSRDIFHRYRSHRDTGGLATRFRKCLENAGIDWREPASISSGNVSEFAFRDC